MSAIRTARLRVTGFVAAMSFAFAASAADEASRADLPPLAAATAAMMNHPIVLGARSGLTASEANRDQLRAGPHEFAIRADGAQRRVENDHTFNEWTLSVERPLRWPGKRRLDETLGDRGVDMARLAIGDALHEAGRLLLRQWFAWLRERTQRDLWLAQAQSLREQASVTERRMRAGDASRLELNVVEAAVAQAESAAALANSREAAAAAELLQQFPTLQLPERVTALDPESLEGDAETWKTRVLEHNHELALARAQTQQRQLVASRADADRLPDPSVGMRYNSERDGTERIAGVFVSIPLPGEGRLAAARGAEAGVGVAAQHEAAVLRKVSAEAMSAYARATGSIAAWRQSEAAAERMRRNATLTARGYELGEVLLSDVLIAKRAAIEAELTAVATRLDAAEARYRLLLDAHELWPLDADADDSSATR